MSRSTSSIEAMFIASVLTAKDAHVAFGFEFKPDDFRAYGDEWGWVINYHKRHKRLPSKAAFHTAYPNFPLRSVRETKHFGEEIQTKIIERELGTVLKTVAQLMGDGDLDSALRYMHDHGLSVGAQRGMLDDGNILTDYDNILEELEDTYDRAEEDGTAGIPMGFEIFDENTGGAKPGELITVAARLGVGKSWILNKWACNSIETDHTALMYTLEMPKVQVWSRMVPLLHRTGGVLINNINLTKGRGYSPSDLRLFMKNIETKLKGKLHIIDRQRSQVTPTSIAAGIERLNPDIVFIDYIQLMSRTKDWQEVEQISGALKDTAMRYGIPIVVASQINREGAGMSNKGEPPGTETLASSDAIGRDSDTVVTAAMLSKHCMPMRCAKNRHGESDFQWKTHFDPGAGIFKQISNTESMQLVAADKLAKQNEELKDDKYTDDDDDDY